MAWIELTVTRFKDKLTSSEKTALDAVGLHSGRTAADTLTAEILSTTRFVRGFTPNTEARGDGETIPDEMEDAALAVLRMKYFTRLPGMSSLYDSARQREYEDALELLKMWASGKFHCAPPFTAAPSDEQGLRSGASSITPARRPTDSTALNGFI